MFLKHIPIYHFDIFAYNNLNDQGNETKEQIPDKISS